MITGELLGAKRTVGQHTVGSISCFSGRTSFLKPAQAGPRDRDQTPVQSEKTTKELPRDEYPGVTPSSLSRLYDRAEGSDTEVIQRKDGDGWAVGLFIAEVIHGIAHERRRLFKVRNRTACSNVAMPWSSS